MNVPAMNKIEAAIGKNDKPASLASLGRNRAELIDGFVFGRHDNPWVAWRSLEFN
jgi:hypothetical protein